MKEGLQTLCLLGVGMAIVSHLAYGEKWKRELRVAFALLLVLTLVRPLLPFLGGTQLSERMQDLFGVTTSEEASTLTPEVHVAVFHLGVERALRERFSLEQGTVSVASDAAVQDGTLTVTCVRVTLSGSGKLADVPSLRNYIRTQLQADCEVYYRE